MNDYQADYLIIISTYANKKLPDEYPFGQSRLPVLCITPINEVRSLKSRNLEWIDDIIAMPFRRHALFSWLTQGATKAASPAPIHSENSLLNTDYAYPIKILLAEDNLVNKKLIIRMLSKIGYNDVDWVENGRLAVEAVQKSNYDLIFMDINMPKMDGLTATAIIRKEIPKNAQPVILALTASALKADVLACMEAGMDDFLSKPFRKSELIEVLNKWGK